jgi:hypothetical protein
MNLRTIDNFHKTKLGLLIFGLVELLITYGFACLSIDRGNLWWYLLTLIFFIGTVRNFVMLIGRFTDGKR